MDDKHTKPCSTSLAIREMQIKTSIKCHFTPIRMARIKNTNSNQCWWKCGKLWTLMYCQSKYKMMQLFWKMFLQFLKKLNIELPYDPEIPFLGIYTEKWKHISTQRFVIFIVTLFIIVESWKQLKCLSTDE